LCFPEPGAGGFDGPTGYVAAYRARGSDEMEGGKEFGGDHSGIWGLFVMVVPPSGALACNFSAVTFGSGTAVLGAPLLKVDVDVNKEVETAFGFSSFFGSDFSSSSSSSSSFTLQISLSGVCITSLSTTGSTKIHDVAKP